MLSKTLCAYLCEYIQILQTGDILHQDYLDDLDYLDYLDHLDHLDHLKLKYCIHFPASLDQLGVKCTLRQMRGKQRTNMMCLVQLQKRSSKKAKRKKSIQMRLTYICVPSSMSLGCGWMLTCPIRQIETAETGE